MADPTNVVTPNQITPQPSEMGVNDIAHFAQFQSADGSFVSVGMSGQAIIAGVTAGLGTMATQDADAVAITGGTLDDVIITNASITLAAPLDVASGGTGRATLTAHSILLGNGTSAVTQLTVGTTGQLLVGATGADPAWIAAGTTGQVLVGNTGAAPSFANLSTTAVTSITFGTTGLTPSSATQGAVTVAGTLSAANGGTGVANNAASTITISGNFGTTFTVSNTTALTLPTTGTLVTLAGTETLTNKTVSGPACTFTAVSDGVGNVRTIVKSGSDKTSNYVLQASDNGQFIGIGSGGSIEIPDAVFSTGMVVTIFNNTTGNRTITCTITTAYIAGTDSDKATFTLATRGLCTLLFISGTVVVGTGNIT